MNNETLKELKREEASTEAMKAHTIRIPSEISKEIETFCGQTGIRIATVWRKCVELGWERVNTDE
jgi:hypothetical protein